MAEHNTHSVVTDAPDQPSTTIAAMDQMVARLFAHWRLDTADQAVLMGWTAEPEPLQRLDETVASNEVSERIGHLLAIHAKLRTLFPQNNELAYSCVSSPNRAFTA